MATARSIDRPRRPRPAKQDADGLYQTAVKALARRSRTTVEFKRLLGARAATPAALAEALERLRDHGYLDDARLANFAAAYQKDVHHHGQARAMRDLRARGVDAATATAAVAAHYGEGGAKGEDALLRAYVSKKRLHRPADQKQAASLCRKLLYAGFSTAACQRALRAWRLDTEWLETAELESAALEQEETE